MRIFSHGWSDSFDGPGRRWVVYLKGCNFRCRWCANPEGLDPRDDLLFHAGRAEHARAACPRGAVNGVEGALRLDRTICGSCPDLHCTRVFKHPAFELAGADISVGELVSRARTYRPFFEPGGGATFGGGEPTVQTPEVVEALRGLSHAGIRTAVETNAAGEGFRELIGLADLLICDLKCVTRAPHMEFTGAENAMVLANLKAAAERQGGLLIRITLVPGFNDTDEEAGRIADFLAELKAARGSLDVQILRMHHMAQPKYRALSVPYPMAGAPAPGIEEARSVAARLEAAGARVSVAG